MTQPTIPSITIDTGIKRIAINNDPDRIISFNPKDINFAERFFKLVDELETKWEKYQIRYAEILEDTSEDKNNLPNNMQDQIELVKTFCNEMIELIDNVFGEGTSSTVFQGQLNPEMFVQFIEGITPFIQSTRSEVVKRYLPPEKIKSRSKPRSRTKKK